jgi:PAS domain S-box-containing protein
MKCLHLYWLLLQPDKESDPIPKKPMEEKSSSKEESPDLDLNLNSQYILETLPYGFVYQDSSGKIKYANGSAQRILGFTQRQISGKTSLDPDWMAIQEDGSPFLGEAHPSLQALKTGKSFSKVIMGVFNPMQQKYVWISINAVPIQIEESELPIGVYVTFEDVTDYKKNKEFESEIYEKLRQSNLEISQRQSAIDQHAIVAITDTNGTIIYANAKFCEISKYSKEELIGQNHRMINSGYHSKFFFHNMYTTIKNGDTWHGEIRNRAKDGSYYWVATTIAPLKNRKGEIEQFLSIRTDITERVKAEQALRVSEAQTRAILDNSIETILFINRDKSVQFFNDVAKDRTRNVLGKELKIGCSMHDIISEDGKKDFEHNFDMALKGARISIEKVFKVNQLDIWFEIHYAPIKNKSQEIIGVLFTARDISEKKKSEQELNQYTSELESLNLTKDKFFSIIAHDLRNPFAGILGVSEMLEEKLKETNTNNSLELQKMTQLIQTSSRSAYALLENLMQWAKTQTGELNFEPIITSIDAIIEATLPLVNGNAYKKNISIEKDLCPEKFIFADPALTNTILRNILTNAIKFTYPNGKIKIATRVNDSFVEVSISDNGIGIKEENINKLFRIDSKFSKIGTDSERGTGLGLILCKEFVEKQGGIIRVESEFGKGSTFTFSLPVAR